MTPRRPSSVVSDLSQPVEIIEARQLPRWLLVGSSVAFKLLKRLSSPVVIGPLSSTPIPPIAPYSAPARAVARALALLLASFPGSPGGKYVIGQRQEPGQRLTPTARPWDLNRCNTRGRRTTFAGSAVPTGANRTWHSAKSACARR
jgi:hypothetical protein